MPLPNGSLTDIEFRGVSQKLLEIWNSQGGRKPCRICGNAGYYIHPSLVGNRSDTVSPWEAHSRLPAVVVYCSTCGLSEQYIAWVLGIQPLLPAPEASAT